MTIVCNLFGVKHSNRFQIVTRPEQPQAQTANISQNSNLVQYNLLSHRGNLERVVGATVVKVMAHTGDKESKNLYVSNKEEKNREDS